MLNFVLSFLVASSATAALSTSYWFTERILKVDQAPLTENVASLPPAAACAEEQPPGLAAAHPVSLVYQFKDPVVLENLAARSNGHLLLTSTSHSAIHYINPRGGPVSKLNTFPEATSTTGIVEITEDVFVVAIGNYSSVTFNGIPGTFSVWSVDLTKNTKNPTVKKITDIPEADALNGMTTVEGVPDLVLISDSSLGGVWRVNTTSGEYDMAQRHVLFTNCTSTFPLGINGIRTYEEKLYFVNSAQRLYGRVAIDKTGNATAEPEILARAGEGVFAWDDLAIDWEGNGWIATHLNMVTEVTVGGKQRNITAGDDRSEIVHPTSIVWGRGSQAASKTLYVVTAGELENGKSGTVIAVDTRLI